MRAYTLFSIRRIYRLPLIRTLFEGVDRPGRDASMECFVMI